MISLNYEKLEYTENIILSKLPDKATRDDREKAREKARENTIRLNRGLWLDETIFSRVRNSFRLWLLEVKSETLFHKAKFDAKISVCIK